MRARQPAARRGPAILVAAVLAVGIAACSTAGEGDGSPGTEPAIRVVATTTVLADLAANVGAGRIEVTSLVPKGGEVHTFDPSPSAVARVAEADLVLMNGLGLDEWVRDLVAGSGGDAVVVELGEDLDGVQYLTGDEEHGEAESPAAEPHPEEGVNPHLWLNVEYARRYAERMASSLADLDPEGDDAYQAAAAEYGGRLDALDASIRERMAEIPEDRRRVVSFHEAFPYFAAAYGLEVVGVVVDAPGQDPSAGEIAALVDAIRGSGARAVLAEAQFSDRLARAVADEAGVKVETGLYNDSLGDPPVDTYVGMMEHNVERIEEALR